MKLLFLDVDGVISTPNQWHGGIKTWITFPSGKKTYGLEKTCVERLYKIVNATDCHLVLSSSWRKGYSIEDMNWLLSSYGQICTLYGMTSNSFSGRRGDEIQKYLDEHKYCKTYVVLDDDIDDMTNLPLQHVIQCKGHLGLQDKDMLKAIVILNQGDLQ